MSASLLLKGSPAGLSDLGDGTVSFQNAALQGVKSISGGDAAGLPITATGAGGIDLVASAGNVAIASAATVALTGVGTAIRTGGAAAGTFTVAKNTAGAVAVAAYLPISVGGVNYWIPLCPTDPQTT
jgi:hypothetical protein